MATLSQSTTSTFPPGEKAPSYEQACGTTANPSAGVNDSSNADRGQGFVFNGAIPANTGPRLRNVILFGQTGAGKSSIINLLAESDVAKTSSGLKGCTLDAQEYSFTFPEEMSLRIFDTVGLEEPEIGVNTFFGAIEKACQLIKNLRKTGGIDLLVFCIHGGRVTTTMQRNYRLFFEILCGRQVPIAIVVTNLEQEDVMENWWARNAKTFEQYGIDSVGHACITALPDRVQTYARKRTESKTVLRRMLLNALVNANTPYVEEEVSWLRSIFSHLGSLFTGAWSSSKRELLKRLEKGCGFQPSDAAKLVQILVTSTQK